MFMFHPFFYNVYIYLLFTLMILILAFIYDITLQSTIINETKIDKWQNFHNLIAQKWPQHLKPIPYIILPKSKPIIPTKEKMINYLKHIESLRERGYEVYPTDNMVGYIKMYELG